MPRCPPQGLQSRPPALGRDTGTFPEAAQTLWCSWCRPLASVRLLTPPSAPVPGLRAAGPSNVTFLRIILPPWLSGAQSPPRSAWTPHVLSTLGPMAWIDWRMCLGPEGGRTSLVDPELTARASQCPHASGKAAGKGPPHRGAGGAPTQSSPAVVGGKGARLVVRGS